MWSVIGFALWVGMHGYFIHNGAQTLGKRWLGLQVVNDADSKPASYPEKPALPPEMVLGWVTQLKKR